MKEWVNECMDEWMACGQMYIDTGRCVFICIYFVGRYTHNNAYKIYAITTPHNVFSLLHV